MSARKIYIGNINDSRVLLKDRPSSAVVPVLYSEEFRTPDASVWNAHMVWRDQASDYAATVTLWASSNPRILVDSDVDWVQMEAIHGWNGLPGGNPTGGSGQAMTDVAECGALWYRFKIERTAGAAQIDFYVSFKR